MEYKRILACERDAGYPEIEKRDAPPPRRIEIALRPGAVSRARLAEVEKLLKQQPAYEQADSVIYALCRDWPEIHDLLRKAEYEYAGFAFSNQSVSTDLQERNGRLADFVNIAYRAAEDVPALAKAFESLEVVDEAVVVPEASPPQASEPLEGTNDDLDMGADRLERQWYRFRCGAHRLPANLTGEGVVIADVDFGFLPDHQELRGAIKKTRNAFRDTDVLERSKRDTHGTAVLGIAAARANGAGLRGFAPRATLWAIQAHADTGKRATDNSWASGVDWVRQQHSRTQPTVLLIEAQAEGSAANYELSPSLNKAIRDAIAAGVVVCVAAGNGRRDANLKLDGTPIRETGSILVGATEFHRQKNVRAGFSNFGQRVVVSAPGDQKHDVTCTGPTNEHYTNEFGGTSGATPKVAGTIALMLERNPSLTHGDVRRILQETGSLIESEADKPVGVFLNTAAAVERARR